MEHILITGTTGLIGGIVAAQLLTRKDTFLILPVRAGSETEAYVRLAGSLKRFTDVPLFEERVKIIAGDLAAVADSSDRILKDVTHVVHAAADTSFLGCRNVWQVNYDDTCRFAERMRRCPQLKRFLYVGTAWICGNNPPAIVKEDLYPMAGIDHHVEYSRSKAATEQHLASMSDFPLLIVRPSVVVGHTTLGCKPTASLFWVFFTFDRMRQITWSQSNYIDVVPADYVGFALQTLLFLPEPDYRCYHISSGLASSCNWQQIANAFGLVAGESAKPNPYNHVNCFSDEALEQLYPTSVRRLRRAIELYARFASHNTIFDNTRLLEVGCPPPPRFIDWIPQCLETIAGRKIDDLMGDD
ncbi:MAG: SDR family oxidoreductase [Desmonostoc geniculatum HA4340-LM1]|jgi:nucleoside-diphosphate-sugar epimerase|nr:SDR family oxidoreductase [Desmonostoc geniculatum HA4340-LM1]